MKKPANPWEILHRRAAQLRVTTPWLNLFWWPRVRCPKCRAEGQKVLADLPFRPADQFSWSVDFHNAINSRLGKPQITVDQARVVWAPGPGSSVHTV